MDKLPISSIVEQKYQVLSVLGIGGMGIVYRVRQLNLDTDRALKTIFTDKMSDEIWQRFEQEARAISRLDHKNLIKVFDFGLLEKRTPYYVMEIVEGKNLSERIRKSGPLTVGQALSVFIPTALALDYVHGKNIVHRDIKPANIMFSEDAEKISTVKILDFGIAKLVSEAGHAADLTKPGEVLGSPNFMSPEQSRGTKIDYRSDIYSFGCSLFEALAGSPPFQADSHVEAIMMHQFNEPPTLNERLPEGKFSNGIEIIMQVLLQKDPQDRYQTMEEVAQDLLALQSGRPPRYAIRLTGDRIDNAAGEQRIKQRESTNDTDDTNNDTGARQNTSSSSSPSNYATMIILAVVLLSGLVVTFSIVLITGGIKAPKPVIAAVPPPPKEIDQGSGLFSHLESDSSMVVFNFPSGVSLGKISTSDYSRVVEATGKVTMPLPWLYRLRLSKAGANHPEYLRRFRVEEIGVLDCSGFILNDKQLAGTTHLNKITSLDISGSELTEKSLPDLNRFTHLKELTLSASSLKDGTLARLKRLRALTSLEAREITKINATLGALAGSKALKELMLSESNQKDEILPLVAKDTELDYLSLSGNPRLTTTGLKVLSALTKLEHVSLLAVPLTPDVIPTLTSFRHMKELKISTKGWTENDKRNLRLGLPRGCHCLLGKAKETVRDLDDFAASPL